MYQERLFNIFTGDRIYPFRGQLIHGILWCLFGILIVLFPQIVAVMVASVFILIGVLLISSAWTFQRLTAGRKIFRDEFYNWV